ncbi:MAG: VpaChn25_0724 family phage protein [Sphingopyxis solisilvae]|uniref:VpaChn25_0724 family phage protein n=1 Tax=Sphingopyxis solisilvae TaxID=1886788 RepID=UPI004036733F
MSYKDAIAHDARLIILRELSKQVNGTLYVISLRRVLDVYGIARPIEWIETQLNFLEQLDAIELTRTDDVLIASIAQAGRDHVGERLVLGGVTRPSELG